MDALDCIKTRRSVRSYRPGEIDKAVIEDIIDCGRLAATGINIQPWKFVCVTDKETREKIAGITNYGKFIAEASLCVCVLGEETKYYLEDCSAATQNIMLAAHAHGLASCWVAGDKKEYCGQIEKIVGAPENYKLVSLIAVGYGDAPGNPSKKSLSEVMSWETF